MRNINSITVRELREQLEDYKGTAEDDLPAVIVYDYGDYHHTAAIDPIDEVRVMDLITEAYSRSGYGVAECKEDRIEPDDEDDEDDAEDDAEDAPKVMVLGTHFVGGR